MGKGFERISSLALLFGAMNDSNHVSPSAIPVPSYKRKKCKSCDQFDKSTKPCYIGYVTKPTDNACEQYKPKKK